MKCILSGKLRVHFIFEKRTLGRGVHEFGAGYND